MLSQKRKSTGKLCKKTLDKKPPAITLSSGNIYFNSTSNKIISSWFNPGELLSFEVDVYPDNFTIGFKFCDAGYHSLTRNKTSLNHRFCSSSKNPGKRPGLTQDLLFMPRGIYESAYVSDKYILFKYKGPARNIKKEI